MKREKTGLKLLRGTKVVSFLFIAISLVIAAGVMFAANMYYDLDLNIAGSSTPGIVTEDPLSLGTSSSAGELVINDGVGHQLIFKANSSMTENSTYTWPAATPPIGTNKILMSDGNGNLDWTDLNAAGGVGKLGDVAANYVTFWGDSNNVTGRSSFFWDPNLTRLGINADGSPSYQLDVREAYFDAVERYDGSSYTDNTAESKTAEGTEYQVLTSTSDEFYVGFSTPFSKIYFDFKTGGVGIALSAEYSKGSSNWGTLSITDNTSNLSTDGSITFTPPSDWATDTVDGSTKYWVRLKTTSSPTTTPTAYVTLRDDSGGVLAVYSNGSSDPVLKVGNDGKVYFKDYPIAYSGKQVLRGEVPIMGFDLPVQCSSACDGSDINHLAKISREIENYPFPNAESGSTRVNKLAVRYSTDDTANSATLYIYDETESACIDQTDSTGQTTDNSCGTNSAITLPVTPSNDLNKGIATITTVVLPHDSSDVWEVRVKAPSSSKTVRIYQVLLQAYDQID